MVLPAFQQRRGAGADSRIFAANRWAPADYLAVAEAVRVLILEDIPHLSRSNYNEAKRFVTLIDALYEAKVRLIVTAADIPERLYVEGEGTFEFERTASRLREMQSEGWGSGRGTCRQLWLQIVRVRDLGMVGRIARSIEDPSPATDDRKAARDEHRRSPAEILVCAASIGMGCLIGQAACPRSVVLAHPRQRGGYYRQITPDVAGSRIRPTKYRN